MRWMLWGRDNGRGQCTGSWQVAVGDGSSHPDRAQGAKSGCWERGVLLAELLSVEMTPELVQLQREARGGEVFLRGLRKSFSPCLRAAVVNGSFEL